MADLSVDLQEGFADDRVIVEIDGQPVFDDVVTTHLMHGSAASFMAPMTTGSIKVTVRLPLKHLAANVDLDGHAAAYLGVAVRDGAIEFRPSDRPFAYV